MNSASIKCGDCKYFVRNGKCSFYQSPANRGRDFEDAPFWVWSDCYSDKEQVTADVVSSCATFEVKS